MAVLLLSGSKEYACDLCVGQKIEAAKHFSLMVIENESLAVFCDALMESCQSFPSVEVLVDLSILDVAFYSKGIFGGLSTRELLYIIHRLKMMRNFRSLTVMGEGPLVQKVQEAKIF